ncbi:hypothetical protein ACQPZG_26145 [Streptomyces sp. CA-294286]|uniref:hypothetical protein n=1 Tax=Streptomyces sp. CA-294286 TaxID=3240070 RepID=UPI003D8D6510
MTRRTRPGAAAATALAVMALTGGCGGPDREQPPPAAARTPSFPALTTTPPAEICANLTSYWVRERLAGRGTGDYMKEGLSNAQNTIVLTVMAAAREERERAGEAAAEELITARTKSACAERYRVGTPSGTPWH